MTEFTNHELLCLELAQMEGIGLRRFADLYAAFRTIEGIWTAEREELERIVPEKQAERICKGPDPERTLQIVSEWKKRGISFCTKESAIYPLNLKKIYDAPPILYYLGDPRLLQTEMMAVVGARRCTPYGRRVAEEIGYRLSQNGYTIVSGMAYGIDACSHQGALKAHKNTIAVLANGLDICYPKDHYVLWKQIRDQGLLVSEYPPGTEPRAGFFPLRNRIISGMSQGVILVEAAEKSGSLITADQALEQGRDVYCIPGSIYSSMSIGVHRLVQQGAILISHMEDLPVAAKKTTAMCLSETEAVVYAVISAEGVGIQEIADQIHLPFQEILQAVSSMEIYGIIEQTENQKWIRK